MKRILGLAVLAASFTLVGCGSDPREGVISTTIENMRNASTQLANIKDRVNEMVKKTEKGTPDTKPVLEAVKTLKEVAKEVQKQNLRADKLTEELTKEQKEKLESKFRNNLNEALVQLTTERKALSDALAAAEAKFKDTAQDLRKKIEEAEGDFEVIARTR